MTRLYYAGLCPKCRIIARIVAALSCGTVEPVAMEHDDAWAFYTDRYPQARGYPVLLTPQGAIFGPRVFGATLGLVVRSWLRR